MTFYADTIYLHYALDQWVDDWRKTQASGEVIFVRYADDFVVGFQHKEDAETFQKAMQERLAEHGLQMHEEKTRLIEFGCHAHENRRSRGEKGKPETFDFLGFTHYCTTTRAAGKFIVGRKTIAKKMYQKMEKIKVELKKRMHRKVKETGIWLRSVLQGIYNFAGVPGNSRAMYLMRERITRLWLRTLRRRSQKGQNFTWEDFSPIAKHWLPIPKIKHPYPDKRLCVSYSR